MDISAYISPIITVVIAVFTAYITMKNANEQLSIQIASLTTKVDDLKEDVEKHNSLIERIYKLESDNSTAFKRIDELRESIKSVEKNLYTTNE